MRSVQRCQPDRHIDPHLHFIMSHLPIRSVNHRSVSGEYVQADGECWYKISNSHRMPEFFMSLVSSSDHWMFISSQARCTAGRCNADAALFPYYSADKIVDIAGCTGPQTIIRTRNWRASWRLGSRLRGDWPQGNRSCEMSTRICSVAVCAWKKSMSQSNWRFSTVGPLAINSGSFAAAL